MVDAIEILDMHVEVQHYPRYDEAHGTPDPMVRRTLVVRLGGGSARFEQSDYGHPGRLNAWEPRGIDAALEPHTTELLALCDAVTRILAA